MQGRLRGLLSVTLVEGGVRAHQTGNDDEQFDHEPGLLVEPGAQVVKVGFIVVIQSGDHVGRCPSEPPPAPAALLAREVDQRQRPCRQPAAKLNRHPATAHAAKGERPGKNAGYQNNDGQVLDETCAIGTVLPREILVEFDINCASGKERGGGEQRRQVDQHRQSMYT